MNGYQPMSYIPKDYTKSVVILAIVGKASHAACMLTFALIIGKPYEGKLHVRLDEEVGETGKLGASSLLYLVGPEIPYNYLLISK